MLYHMTTAVKPETAIEEYGQTHQAVAYYHIHILAKSGCV